MYIELLTYNKIACSPAWASDAGHLLGRDGKMMIGSQEGGLKEGMTEKEMKSNERERGKKERQNSDRRLSG